MLHYALLGILLVLSLATAHAGVYKWIDEDGNVQYSDDPQARKEAQSVPMQKIPEPDPETLKRSEDQQRYLDARGKEREQAQADKEEKAKEAAKNKEICDNAKSRLAILQEGGRIYTMDAKGERSYLTEENRQAQMTAMKSTVAKNCK